MATRTIQFLGLAYGENPATVNVTANGNTVFSGTVSTVNEPFPSLPNPDLVNDMVPLFDMEIDTSFTGQIPMTCQVSSEVVLFGVIRANYVGIFNPVYTPEEVAVLQNPASTLQQKVDVYIPNASPPLTQTEIDALLDPNLPLEQRDQIITEHNLKLIISSGQNDFGRMDNFDPRLNIIIDGVPQTPDYDQYPGTWWWTIPAGSTLAYDLDVEPAVV